MNQITRRTLLLCGALLIATLTALFSSPLLAQSAAPAASSELRVAGLRDRVIVQRDERGVPYIAANNDHDLNFAQGWVMASDRLWQMDLLRRSARGELAEIFGKTALAEDQRRRTFGFARLSEQVAANVSAAHQPLLAAFASGVNAYIAALDEKTLPREFGILKYRPRPWTPADSLVIGLLMHESLSTTWQTDVLRAALAALPADKREALLPEFTKLDTPVVGNDRGDAAREGRSDAAKKRAGIIRVSPELLALALRDESLMKQSLARVGLDAEAMAASNNWVVSGKRTASGKPLLANDPHLAPSVPSIWYLVHLSAPGVRVAGVTIPGINGVIIGHNERIAWGLTNLGPDVQDLYLEKFDPENPRRYLTPDGWKDAEIRREEIKVRKVPTDPATETVRHEVTVTRHGPIVLEKGSERYALRWTALDPRLESVTMFYKLNRARHWKEFSNAVSTYAGATQNFVYADVDGHIGYYGAGYIPIRKSGDGSLPYDGSKDDGEWTGWIPPDRLPHVYDPPSGMIVTANARIVGRSYPYHLTHGWSAPYRQKRINEMLAAKNKLTIDDFRAVQGDVYAIGAMIFVREVTKLLGHGAAETAGKGDGKAGSASAALLAAWDGRLTPDSRAALLVHEMREVFYNRALTAGIGADLAKQYRWGNRHSFIDYLITERPQAWLPKEFTSWKDFVLACDDEARANLTKKFGADESKWTFGKAVQVRFNHPLASAPFVGVPFKIEPFPQQGNGYGGGAGPTVNVGPSVSMRLIADPSNWDNTQHGITLGQSGDPQSQHYKDQLSDWRNVTPRAFPFSKAAVTKAAKQTMTLVP